MIRQRASAPSTRERRSRQRQQQQQLLPQYHPYQSAQSSQQPQSIQQNNSSSIQQQQRSWNEDDGTTTTTTWSNTQSNNFGDNNNSNDADSDDLVDEELGAGETDQSYQQQQQQQQSNHPLITTRSPSPQTIPHSSGTTSPVGTAVPTNPSYYRALYFQIPDSKYRDHLLRLHHHHPPRLSSSASPYSATRYNNNHNATSKYRFLYFFSSSHMFARALGWFCLIAVIFLLFVGMLIDVQPLYIRGVMPRTTADHPRALRKFKVLIPTAATTKRRGLAYRLDPAKHAFQAAFAYFVTLCVCWTYGYHGIERIWSRIRRRHYRDIPDHYHPDNIHNSHDDVMSNVATILSSAPSCSRVYSRSRRICQWCRNGGATAGWSSTTSSSSSTWQHLLYVFVVWCRRFCTALVDTSWRTFRKTTTFLRFSNKQRRKARRSRNNMSSTTTTSSRLDTTTTTTTTPANATTASRATQRKRRQNTTTTNSPRSMSPAVAGGGDTAAATRNRNNNESQNPPLTAKSQ